MSKKTRGADNVIEARLNAVNGHLSPKPLLRRARKLRRVVLTRINSAIRGASKLLGPALLLGAVSQVEESGFVQNTFEWSLI